ncbi:MAG: deoxynucleoside kinase [Candidatus Marinimicrobia bacterium]|nr:deoxynucleoside kinase [Candidatus Neomarinimicrobiota bacterium]MDD5582357.1 deoxynucleoside kinase [Candidatus Neomarinimicrobiota bacterium]
MKPAFIGIAGNIGVGKTTFTKMLCDYYHWDPHFEVVVDNPYLADFYEDMKRWSFHLQIFFLGKRFKVQKKIQNLTNTIVQDRTIYEDAMIFAKSIHEFGNMTDRDWACYLEIFYEMTSYLKKPDLIVYLQASTDSLISRIRKRGRDYEQSIDPEYLHLLNIHYDEWIQSLQKSGEMNTIVIPTDSKDFITDETFRIQCFESIYLIVANSKK